MAPERGTAGSRLTADPLFSNEVPHETSSVMGLCASCVLDFRFERLGQKIDLFRVRVPVSGVGVGPRCLFATTIRLETFRGRLRSVLSPAWTFLEGIYRFFPGK